MPQDDPLIAAVRRARQARAGAPQADPLLQEIQRIRAASTTPPGAVIPNDTTVGPNGIRADDPEAVQRYLDSLNEDGAQRDSVARATPAAPLTHEQRATAVRPRYVPGYAGMRMPWNEAARDEATAQEYKGEAGERQLRLDVMSPRTRALGYGVAGGRTILGIPGFVRTVLEAAGRPFVGRHTQRALASREASERAAGLPVTPEPGVQLARMPLDIAEMMGRAGQRDPEALGEVASLLATGPKPKLRGRGATAPVAARAPGRPTVPYELDITEPPSAGAAPAAQPTPKPKTPRPGTRGAIRAELDNIITRQRAELSPGPADLDAMIRQQQAELAATRKAADWEEARVNDELDTGLPQGPGKDPIADALQRADVSALEAELAARKPKPPPSTPEQRAPDAIRDLPIEALGETPPFEQSAAATQDARIPEIAERILEKERRLEQRAFEGPERRAPEQARAELERQGFMGTGPESMTPEDVAGTRILGGEVVGEIRPKEPAPPEGPVPEGASELDAYYRSPEVQARINRPAKIVGEKQAIGATLLEDMLDPAHLGPDGRPLSLARRGDIIDADMIERFRDAGLDLPIETDRGFLRVRTRGASADEMTGIPVIHIKRGPGGQPIVSSIKPATPAEGAAHAERINEYGAKMTRQTFAERVKERDRQARLREPDDVRVPGTRPGKMPPLPPKKPPTAMGGAEVPLDPVGSEFLRLSEILSRSENTVEVVREAKKYVSVDQLRTMAEDWLLDKEGTVQARGESVYMAAKHILTERQKELANNLSRKTERPPTFTDEGTLNPIDFNPLDAQIEALRAEQARLRESAERSKVEHPGEHPSFARKARLREKGGAGAEAEAARKKVPSRRELEAEARSVRATLRQAEKELQRYPEYDKREHALLRRNQAMQLKLAAQDRLAEIENLKKMSALKRPPLKGPKGTMGPGLGGEGGFLLNPFAKKRPAAPLSAAEAAVDKQIGRGVLAERTPLRVRWHQLIQNLTETSHFVGKLQRIAEKHGRQLPLTQKARYWMKAALDSPKRIAGALYGEGGPGYFDDTGKWTPLDSPSLEAIIKPIAGDVAALQRVERLLLAEHNPAMLAAKRQTNISPAAAAEVVRTATPRTQLVAAKMRGWLNATVEGAVRAGALPRSLLDAWQKQYPHYIPAERVFEGEGAVSGGGGSTRGGVRPPARRAKKGGPQPYASPFETIPDYGARWIRYTDLYRASRSTLDLVTQNRDIFGDLAVKVSEKPLAQVNAVEAIGELLSDKALRLEGDQIRVYDPATNSMQVWKLEPILADGLRALTAREWDFVTEFLGAGKRGVQFGVTNNPFFGLANYLRDNAGRAVMSGATHYPMAKTFGSSPEFRTMGGGFGIAEESAGFAESLRRSLPGRSGLRSAQRTRQGRAAKLTGTVSTPVRTVRGLSEALKSMSVPFEEATRGAEFRAQRAKGLSDLEAYVNAQEALGNFAEHGTAAWVRWLNHVTPFLNPRIQGLRAFYEAGTRRPGSTALKAALTITIPSVVLYALQQDDQEIEDLRNGPGGYNSWYIRPSNILPMLPDDIILRVPKPFMPGALAGTSVEHALDALRDRDPHAFKRMLSDISSELWQSSINPVFGVPRAIATNKAIGTGVPIVPEEQKKFLPEEQVGTHPNYTLQELSRMLPERARFSPARAQYALGQFGGTMGREIPNFLDRQFQADRIPEPRGLTDFPGVSRFFARTPTSAAAPIRDVYNDSRRGVQIMETLQGLAANGDVTGALRLLEEHGDELAAAGAGQAYTQKLSQIADAAEFFANSEHLTPRERREYRDEMLRLMTDLARTFHDAQHDRAPQ